MLHYRLLYLKYLPLPVSGKAAAVLRTCPPLSLLYYFNSCQPNLFKIAPLCICSFSSALHSSQTIDGKMLWRKGKRKRGIAFWDHILASMRRYVALSFLILLSALDRQLNKKNPPVAHVFAWELVQLEAVRGLRCRACQTMEWRLGLGPPHLHWAPGNKGGNGCCALAKTPSPSPPGHLP